MATEDWYIEVPLESDETTMADEAVERLQDQWPDWEPNEGDMEVVQIEALAGIAAALARQSSLGTEEIFRAFGTKLVGVGYQQGAPAVTTVTFTLTDSETHVIEAETEIEIDGLAFLTTIEAANPAGTDTVPGVPVEASVAGTLGNGLGASASRISSLAFVADVTADTLTSGGVDAMGDDEYLGYLSRRLQLRADTIVTKRDHEYWALDWPGVGRAFAEHVDDRHVRIYVADVNGEKIDDIVKTDMETAILDYRLVNTITDIEDPSYTTVGVTYEVHALRGYDLADLELRADGMLASWLSPSGFAQPKFGDPGVQTGNWVGTNLVRVNSAIDRLGDVEGVDYVDDVVFNAGGGGALDADGNVVMAGTIALPRIGTINSTVSPPA
jgi:hypothetical protein